MSIKFSDIFSSVDDKKLEEVINKTKDVAETVGKKSAERLEISRKKVELIDGKTKLAKLYERLGKLYYTAFIGEQVNEDDIHKLADEIAAQKAKNEALQLEIDIAKEEFNSSVSTVANQARDAFSGFRKTDGAEVESQATPVEDTETE